MIPAWNKLLTANKDWPHPPLRNDTCHPRIFHMWRRQQSSACQPWISQRLPRFLWNGSVHSIQISCNLTACLPLQHDQDNTKTPSQKAWLSCQSPHQYTAQLPSYAGAPFGQAGKQQPFYHWTRFPESCAVQRQPVRTVLPPQLTSEMLL